MPFHLRIQNLIRFLLQNYVWTAIHLCPLFQHSSTYISNRNTTDISSALLNYQIIPDLLRIPPSHTLKATYSYGYSPNLGNRIQSQYLKHNPYVILWPFDGKKFYTLILVDLDAPSRIAPTKREWLHYMLGNIPGPAVSQGEIIAPYVQPDPHEDTRSHRLVFMVFQQPLGRVSYNEKRLEPTTDAARAFFSTRTFANKYHLGEPFAVNFFLLPPHTKMTTQPSYNITEEGKEWFKTVTDEN